MKVTRIENKIIIETKSVGLLLRHSRVFYVKNANLDNRDALLDLFFFCLIVGFLFNNVENSKKTT